MGEIYANTRGRFYENSERIMNFQVKYGSLSKSFHKLDKYINYNADKYTELAYRDKKLEKAVNRYAADYRKKNASDYPEHRMFFEIKDEMEKDTLFKLIKKMPKGSLLHVHSIAGLSFERLVVLCRQWNTLQRKNENKACIIRVNTMQVTSKVADYTLMYAYQEEDLKSREIPTECQDFDTFIERKENLEKLKEALCITRDIENSDEVWREFNIKYSRFNMLFKIADFYYNYHRIFFYECVEDNIDYVEIRCGFEKFDKIEKNSREQYCAETLLRANDVFNINRYLYYKDYLQEFSFDGEPTDEDFDFLEKIYLAARDIFDEDGHVKVILTANRGSDPALVSERRKLEDKGIWQ